MSRYTTAIHWFRRDLRLTDNPSLFHAVAEAAEVVPVYIQSEWTAPHAWTGAGRQAFLCGSLASLAKNLERAGGRLFYRRGGAREELEKLIRETKAEALFFNHDPDPFGREREDSLRQLCHAYGIACRSFHEVSLHPPGEVLTAAGKPYQVYTAFAKQWFSLEKPDPLPAVKSLRVPEKWAQGSPPSPEDWGLAIERPLSHEPGERAARERLRRALEHSLPHYAERRDDPAAEATSHLGADLRYGTLSVREVFRRAEEKRGAAGTEAERKSIHTFQKQLAWREFFLAILHHHPEVLETDFDPRWRGLRWDDPGEDDRLQRWKDGLTGFPLVDAGMRQLRETGTMHNRVRMIVAMFLTKDLHLHWRLGESHFLQFLLDGEIANNNGGWQWSAGTGADAAPYFRIQNPWTQTAKYDPEGEYIRRWVPELARVAPRFLQAPPAAGTRLAPDYPAPMVDHKVEREETLERFNRHRAGRG